MDILVTYGTIEGHTKKIARHIANQIEKAGHQIVLSDARDPGHAVPKDFDAVILCGSIHFGRYPEPITRFAKANNDALNNMPSALVTVSLAAASEIEYERVEAHAHAHHLVQATGWVPDIHHSAAGAIKFTEFNYFKRYVAKHVSAYAGGPVDTSKDYELTDWSALSNFVAEILAFALSKKATSIS